jgi:hypothetical protein
MSISSEIVPKKRFRRHFCVWQHLFYCFAH